MLVTAAAIGMGGAAYSARQHRRGTEPQSFKFRTGVELINVNATVTDQSGRFVPGLRKDDFRVFDDEQPQAVTHFNAERVPVSLGIVLDTSGSMDGDKIDAARAGARSLPLPADRSRDEVFLYRFDNAPELVEGWTRDKRRISDSLGRIQPRGSTALYDAVAEAVRLAQQGHNRKKAVVIISDGNDTSSRTDIFAVKQLIRETRSARLRDRDRLGRLAVRQQPVARSAAAAAAAPDSAAVPDPGAGGRRRRRRRPCRSRRRARRPAAAAPGGAAAATTIASTSPRCATSPTTAAAAPRSSAGRATSIPAVAGIADELSKQVLPGLRRAGAKDGRWHAIRVEVEPRPITSGPGADTWRRVDGRQDAVNAKVSRGRLSRA